ncbi:MAG: phosphatase PAP2 family protein [Deltaproteobacteria bacterium]|nr:phosphatase PAP2 family protein [Candidatus Zymogenaceae bacterium]
MLEYLSSPDIIRAIQTIANPVLDWFFIAVTFLGNEDFYIAVLPIIYWCVDKKFGIRLAIVFLASVYLNSLLKDIFATERPDPSQVRVLYGKSGGGYSFPSGHAQGSTTFWGVVAWELKKTWFWVLALFLMVAVGISRLYLGVHWPIDVVGGWLIGAVILGVYFLYDAKVDHSRSFLNMWGLIVLVIVVGVGLFLIHPAGQIVGVFVGMTIGYLLEEKLVNFDPRSVWWYQILKVLVGLAVVFALRIGLKKLFPETDLFDAIRYLIIGFWIALGVPAIFRGRKN